MSAIAISIITPCMNRAELVASAVKSVLSQDRRDVEHIIVDGGSTDGTLEVLRLFSHLRVSSEPDAGMYDALNKGLALAQGEVVGFLNTDDNYVPGAFDAALQAFDTNKIVAVAGEAIFVDFDSGGVPREAARFRPRSATLLEHATLGAPSFNAWFFRRSLFESLGRFDSRYRIAGDREFMLRLALSTLDYAVVDSAVYQYRRHSDSLTFGSDNFESIVAEHVMMTDDYLAHPGLSRQARTSLSRLRTRDTLNLGARCLRQARIGAFLRCLSSGTRRDPLWAWQLACRALR
jgi:glycosyltransferase involved in cell wall biosynthesis